MGPLVEPNTLSREPGAKLLAHIPAAGKVPKRNSYEGTKQCLDFGPRPTTPEKELKYRQSTLHEPGKIVKHFGSANNAVPEGPYGIRTVSKPNESVPESIRSYPESALLQWDMQRREEVYASSKREPLGKGYVRGHRIPEGLGSHVPFGKPVHARELSSAGQAGKVIFPADHPLGSSQDPASPAHELYITSHGAYSAGEQRRRHYDWQKAGINPVHHAFGAAAKETDRSKESLAALLQPETNDSLAHTRVVDKRLEDFQLTNKDLLGTPKNLGFGERGLPVDHTFGAASVRSGPEFGVDVLIKGNYTAKEQAPDADLGKSLRDGWRNIPTKKTFGLPTVRTDIVPPKHRSVANVHNYGNEPDTMQLIHPTATAERGISEEHYLKLRSKDELRDILAAAGITLEAEEFGHIFAAACAADKADNRCCIDVFMRCRHQLLEHLHGL
ncbi:hypothetical protein WJX72_011725 [[Myrmecia] bisecta]|uniref:EFHB C-terminal EF-hand domain-containing protein n=1 Tax=[Myrmecia] bisecta TaxID=41462 RepID=A0AAW1PAV3_9CHLO